MQAFVMSGLCGSSSLMCLAAFVELSEDAVSQFARQKATSV